MNRKGIDYKMLSFVLRGKRRKAVLLCLNKPKIPKQIAIDCKLSTSNVAIALKELVKRGLARCINPKDRAFKFYEMTKKGEEIKERL
jgi:DNA-binding MarR family transcriptional regulator